MRIRKDKQGIDPIRYATDLEVAWAAGIFEGEGSCSRSGSNKKSFVVSVTQKDPELLYRLRDLFGGRVKLYRNDRGIIPVKAGRLMIFAWRLCGDRARVFLAAIYPFLTARRKSQVDSTSAIHFREFAGTMPPLDFIVYLHDALDKWVISHRSAAKVADKQNRKQYYERKKQSDPLFMEKRKQMTAAWRSRKKADLVGS